MRARWLQWKLAGDLDYVMYEAFAGDLQVMGGGTFINIAKDANAFRQLYRLVLFAIQHQNQLIENVFNKWDNCALKKCGMRTEQMQRNVLYVVNELSADHAERRAKHKPLKLKGPRGRAAAGGADGKPRRRDRVVQTAASVSLAASLLQIDADSGTKMSPECRQQRASSLLSKRCCTSTMRTLLQATNASSRMLMWTLRSWHRRLGV